MTSEQEITIVHPSILGQFRHDAASRCIIWDGIPKKFHLGTFGHLEFWEQYVVTVNHAREVSSCEDHVDYLGLLWVYFEANPLQLSDTSLHIAEDRFRRATDRRIIEIPDVLFGLFSTGDLIYCECEQERANRVTLLDI